MVDDSPSPRDVDIEQGFSGLFLAPEVAFVTAVIVSILPLLEKERGVPGKKNEP